MSLRGICCWPVGRGGVVLAVLALLGGLFVHSAKRWGRGANSFTASAVSASQFLPGPAIEGTIFAVTASNKLITFNQANPSVVITTQNITGLQSNEFILGLDFRPRTGQLYALSSLNRLYLLNPATGAAGPIGSGPLTPATVGTAFGFDFNPVPDRLRIVSDADQNLRITPDGNSVTTDGALAFASGDRNAGVNPNIVGAAYTNSFSGATTTTLYGIDSNLDALVLQGSPGGSPTSPNTGTLTTVGNLGVNTSDAVGFDIAGPSGIAFASLTTPGATTSSLYTVDLGSGAARLVGAIGGGEVIRDLAAVVRVETIFALTTKNELLAFSSATPNALVTKLPISGLSGNESLLGLDFRPATGQLYALSDASRLYTINTTTAVATLVVSTPFSPGLMGSAFGFDFNPVPDRIRVVSDAQQNLRLNPNNGVVAGTDTTLAFATGDSNANVTPNLVASAYTNNFAGTPNTTLYGIDAQLDALVLQGSVGGSPVSPNTGQLSTVGGLGFNTNDQVGFDIASGSNAAFASLTTMIGLISLSSLYTVNLNTGAATLIGPIGDDGDTIRDIAIAPRIELIYAVTASNKLISFVSTAPGVILSTATINNLPAGEQINGLDFRPANGKLYALSSSSRIYTIDPLTGIASLVGSGPTNPPVNGSGIGFDFNPVPDRIRVVSSAGQNLRFNPDSGATAATDGPLTFDAADAQAGRTPSLVAAAYNNNFAGTTSTTLYTIDSGSDTLVRQGSPGGTPISPNTGTLFTIGALGVDVGDAAGFDIADMSNNAYASLTVAGVSQLRTINLLTGAASLIGPIGGGELIRGITVAKTPPASAQNAGAVVVNAASFTSGTIAPNSLAALFGSFQTTDGAFAVAGGVPLPTTLGGLRATIGGADAQLLFASNGQVNFVAPNLAADGPTPITITNANGMVRTSFVNIVRAAPGLFTYKSTGTGVAAAMVTSDGVNFQPIFNLDGTERAVSAGANGAPVFLVLFTTGLRNVPAANPNDGNGVAEAVLVSIKGLATTTMFAGPAPGLVGVDQVNVMIPPQLTGGGLSEIRVTAGGRVSNGATIRLQ